MDSLPGQAPGIDTTPRASVAIRLGRTPHPLVERQRSAAPQTGGDATLPTADQGLRFLRRSRAWHHFAQPLRGC
ncbi:hypothetical protein G6F50_018311 [Rhizopus delemar]|uniref:Uncharacterized protein n=1 Tax=Rhizopus delemar TaxID=936053 RepID=A0A9P6XN67_9FUNG|nr:hypothetical protein G6F50_018311 [Rhizopus delemar]